MQCACAMLSSMAVRSHNIFPNYLINGTIFEKKSCRIYSAYCDSVFKVCMKTFLILRRNERGIIKLYIGLHVKRPLLLSDFNENLTFSTDFLKILNIKLHENPYCGSRVVTCGRTDRHDNATSHF